MPDQPATPSHSFRLGERLWLPAKALAEARGATATDIMKEALAEYLTRAGIVLEDEHTLDADDGGRVPLNEREHGGL